MATQLYYEIIDRIEEFRAERLRDLRMELVFAKAVRSAMSGLRDKAITKRIVATVREILGWENATIVLESSDETLVSWRLTAWGGETGLDYSTRLTAYLGCRGFGGDPAQHSTKCVNFAAWSESSCCAGRLCSEIVALEDADQEESARLATLLVALREAKDAWERESANSPLRSIAQSAASAF